MAGIRNKSLGNGLFGIKKDRLLERNRSKTWSLKFKLKAWKDVVTIAIKKIASVLSTFIASFSIDLDYRENL